MPPAPGAQIAVATIEKACGFVNSLLEENRLGELGLVVIDELHLVGEKERGGTLETLVSKLIKFGKIQIVGMSATIPNLADLQKWFQGDMFTASFRPVPLYEHVVLKGCVQDKSGQIVRKTKSVTIHEEMMELACEVALTLLCVCQHN